MNLTEAFSAAKAGNFVTSSQFSKNQSMHYFNGKYYYEDGAVVPKEFLYREDWAIEHPWEISIPKEKVDFNKLKEMHRKSMGYMLEKGSYMDCVSKFEKGVNNELGN